MERDKQLEVGRTKLGEINAVTPDRKYVTLNVYYGNYLYPMVGDEYQHQSQDAYIKLLNKFLQSEAGKEYIIPTQEEINAACLAVANKEKDFKAKRDEERKRMEERNRKQPMPEYLDENVVPPNLRESYVKPKPTEELEEWEELEEPQRRFEDDEPQEEEKKGLSKMFARREKKNKEKPSEPPTKSKMQQALDYYQKSNTILTLLTLFLTLVILFELLLNVYLLTVR